MARAIATRAKASFLSVKGPELLSSYLGESESNVRALFAKARAASPCVVFLDEIDAIGLSRGSASAAGDATADRVLNQLLTEMDGRIMGSTTAELDEKSNNTAGYWEVGKDKQQKQSPATQLGNASSAVAVMTDVPNDAASSSVQPTPIAVDSSAAPKASKYRVPRGPAAPVVFVVAATNRPDLLDPALLRPGRLDQLLFVGLPNEESRLDILRTLLAQTPCEPAVYANGGEVLRKMASGPCRGLSGADLAHVCNRARRLAIQEFIQRTAPIRSAYAANGNKGRAPMPDIGEGDRLTVMHLEHALAEVQPSVSADVLEKYRLFNAQLRGGNGVTTVNDVILESDGADTSAALAASSASAASANTLAALRESLRGDISKKLSALGSDVDPQYAMNSILSQLLKETNAGKYNAHANGTSATNAAVGSDSNTNTHPVWLGSGNDPSADVPRPRKTGGRER
jgi:SpoVK/Ycf46/Vps4 family AAA+-type ATPase